MRSLLDRIVPVDALRGFAHVAWRKVDSLDDQVRRGEVFVAMPPLKLAGVPHRDWHEEHRWRAWPTMRDMLPVFQVPRGGILYSMPPQHGATRRCSRENPCSSVNAIHVTMWGECFVKETHARR